MMVPRVSRWILSSCLFLAIVPPSFAADGVLLGVHGDWGNATSGGLTVEGDTHGFGAEVGVSMGSRLTWRLGLEYLRFHDQEFISPAPNGTGFYNTSHWSTLTMFGVRISPRGHDRWGPTVGLAAGLELRTGESRFVQTGTNPYNSSATTTRDGVALSMDVGLIGPLHERLSARAVAGALIVRDTPVFRGQIGLDVR